MGFHNDEAGIYIDISNSRSFVVRFTTSFASFFFSHRAFTPGKNESNNYRALCLTRNFHPCRSWYTLGIRCTFYEERKSKISVKLQLPTSLNVPRIFIKDDS